MPLFDEHDLAQPRGLTGSQAEMLAALADIGCNRHALAAFLALDNAHPDHIRFLTGPVIQHRSPWADTTPEWLYRAVAADRLRIILDEHGRRQTGWQVGPAELTAVMYPATMEAPLCREYTDIYLWAAAQASARHYGKSEAEIWSSIGGDPVEDRLIADPAGRYHRDYRRLCTDIRRRVVKAAIASSRAGKSAETLPAVTTEQLSLF
jgi:hypothetical protein